MLANIGALYQQTFQNKLSGIHPYLIPYFKTKCCLQKPSCLWPLLNHDSNKIKKCLYFNAIKYGAKAQWVSRSYLRYSNIISNRIAASACLFQKRTYTCVPIYVCTERNKAISRCYAKNNSNNDGSVNSCVEITIDLTFGEVVG